MLHLCIQPLKSAHICAFAHQMSFNSWTEFGQKLEIWMKFVEIGDF